MSGRPLLFVVCFAVTLAGASCGGSSSSPTDASSADGGADGSPTEGGADGSLLDATPRTDGAEDSAADALPPTLEVVAEVDTFFQSCMPIVSPDPVVVQGNLAITNNGGSAAGPLSFKSGRFLNGTTLAPIATFELDTTSQVIQPGATSQTLFEKTQGTMVPAQGCQTLACNTEVVVELAYAGPGVPAGASVRAPAKKVSCAF